MLPFPIKGDKLYLYNNNPLLRAGFPGTDGVKTGYTTLAGLCLVATARRGHQWLGVVLLHSGNWLTQAEQLLNAGFAPSARLRRRLRAAGTRRSCPRTSRAPAGRTAASRGRRAGR